MPAESIMSEPPVLVKSEQPLEQAIKEMKDKETTIAFVITGDGRMQGVATLEQAEEALEKGVTKTGEIARTEFPSAEPQTPLEQCLPLLAEDDTPLAVLDRRNHLMGVITRPALIEAMQSSNSTNGGK